MNYKDIYLARLHPSYKNELKKYRPVIVLVSEKNLANEFIVPIIPLSSVQTNSKFEIKINPTESNGLKVASQALCWHIKSLDKNRLVKKIGKLNPSEFENIRSMGINYIRQK